MPVGGLPDSDFKSGGRVYSRAYLPVTVGKIDTGFEELFPVGDDVGLGDDPSSLAAFEWHSPQLAPISVILVIPRAEVPWGSGLLGSNRKDDTRKIEEAKDVIPRLETVCDKGLADIPDKISQGAIDLQRCRWITDFDGLGLFPKAGLVHVRS